MEEKELKWSGAMQAVDLADPYMSSRAFARSLVAALVAYNETVVARPHGRRDAKCAPWGFVAQRDDDSRELATGGTLKQDFDLPSVGEPAFPDTPAVGMREGPPFCHTVLLPLDVLQNIVLREISRKHRFLSNLTRHRLEAALPFVFAQLAGSLATSPV